jgi:hypothetical protein
VKLRCIVGVPSWMPVYHYYLSHDVTDPAPAFDAMETIEADSPTDAVERLVQSGRISARTTFRWANFVASVDERGNARGFSSVRLRTE